MGALSFLSARLPEEKSPRDRSIGAAFSVWRALGRGMPTRVYRRALALELTELGLRAVEGAELTVKYRGRVVGELTVDLLVAEQVLVSVRCQPRLGPADLTDAAQVLAAVRVEQGLLINFGAPRLDYRRLRPAG